MRVSTITLLSLFACDGGGGSETDLEAAFCALLTDGPEEDVTATDDGSGPELAIEDVAVEVTLLEDGDGMYWGVARYTADEAGSFAMGLSDDVPLKVIDADGSVLPWENEVAGAGCAELAIRYTVALELAAYTIEFGPTDVDEVSFVSEESDDDL